MTNRLPHPARRRVAMLMSALFAMGSVACSEPPPPCPKPAECAPPPACPAVTQFDVNNLQIPAARFAVETLQNLFNGNYETVRQNLTASLAAELPADKLRSIVDGLVKVHGPPVQIIDAWTSEVKEKEERMPAAQVLLLMNNGTRVNLILVFDPNNVVRGLWLRPI